MMKMTTISYHHKKISEEKAMIFQRDGRGKKHSRRSICGISSRVQSMLSAGFETRNYTEGISLFILIWEMKKLGHGWRKLSMEFYAFLKIS